MNDQVRRCSLCGTLRNSSTNVCLYCGSDEYELVVLK